MDFNLSTKKVIRRDTVQNGLTINCTPSLKNNPGLDLIIFQNYFLTVRARKRTLHGKTLPGYNIESTEKAG